MNDEEAVKWYRKTADQGNASAQTNLGATYWTGTGVGQDKSQAVDWYRKAARQKNALAMFNLGVACYNGEGVHSDGVRVPMRGSSSRRRMGASRRPTP